MNNLHEIITAFNQENVIAYPTEAVFGLGCNPNSEKAVRKLLALKKREERKGLILIAPTVELLLPVLVKLAVKRLHGLCLPNRIYPVFSQGSSTL